MTPVSKPQLFAVGALAPAPDPPESELVVRAVGGDSNAWTRLYQDHFEGLYTDLLYLVHDATTAEELAQESFASALVSLQRFDCARPFRVWLRGIAHNLVRRHWRKHSRRERAYRKVQPSGAEKPVLHALEQQHLDHKRADVLEQVVATLSASYREVFVLRDVQGLAVGEVAARLGISSGNVRVRANRARGRIRSELTRLGWLNGDDA